MRSPACQARPLPPAQPSPGMDLGARAAPGMADRGGSYRVGVERRERGPGRPSRVARRVQRGRLLLPEESRVRLEGQLQVEDVVDDMLQDLHFADPLVGRDGGHQLPEAAVTVIHIALKAQSRRLLARRRAPLVAAMLGQATQSQLAATSVAAAATSSATAAARQCLPAGVSHGTHRFHGAKAGRQAGSKSPRAPEPNSSHPQRNEASGDAAGLRWANQSNGAPGSGCAQSPGFTKKGKAGGGTKQQQP